MTDLILTFDPGSSLGKCIYLDHNRPQLLLIEPDIAVVIKDSVTAYQDHRLGTSNPEDAALIECGGVYRAIGFLARTQFLSNLEIESRKYERAAYASLAVIGALAVRLALPDHFSVALSVLLPYAEWQDRKRFKELIEKYLSDFGFQNRRLSVTLEIFSCRPEGGGLAIIRQGQLGSSAFKHSTLAVLMVGHRDASILVFERGELRKGDTRRIGFIQMVEAVRKRTAGLDIDTLTRKIFEAGSVVDEGAIAPLASSHDMDLRAEEVTEIKQAIHAARRDYWEAIQTWLHSYLPSELDEVVVSGGAATYLRPELSDFFKSVHMSWGANLEEQVDSIFRTEPDSANRLPLASRLVDVWAFFNAFHKKIDAQHLQPMS